MKHLLPGGAVYCLQFTGGWRGRPAPRKAEKSTPCQAGPWSEEKGDLSLWWARLLEGGLELGAQQASRTPTPCKGRTPGENPVRLPSKHGHPYLRFSFKGLHESTCIHDCCLFGRHRSPGSLTPPCAVLSVHCPAAWSAGSRRPLQPLGQGQNRPHPPRSFSALLRPSSPACLRITRCLDFCSLIFTLNCNFPCLSLSRTVRFSRAGISYLYTPRSLCGASHVVNIQNTQGTQNKAAL